MIYKSYVKPFTHVDIFCTSAIFENIVSKEEIAYTCSVFLTDANNNT